MLKAQTDSVTAHTLWFVSVCCTVTTGPDGASVTRISFLIPVVPSTGLASTSVSPSMTGVP